MGGQDSRDWQGQRRNPPKTSHPAGPWPCPLGGPSHSRCLAGIPQLPQGNGFAGLGLVRAAGGRDIDHSSLHSWRSQVAARTIFSSPGGGRGAAGRDEIELVGGEREESRSIRTQAAVPLSNAVQCGVWGVFGWERPPQGVSWGCWKHKSIAVFPVSQSPYLCAQLSPPHPSLALSAALTLPRLSQETVGVTESWGGSGEGGCWITTERGRREAKDRARSKPLAAATVASAHPTYFTDRCRSAGALWDNPASKTPHSPPRTRASCPTCSPSALPCQIPPANENSRILSSAPPGNPGAWPGCSPWGCPM